MELIKNTKVIYSIAIIIIIIGIASRCIWGTNFSLSYKEHEQIEISFEQAYNIDDIKQIVKETFKERKVYYQEVETFHNVLAINIEKVSDEELAVLKDKIQEKYKMEEIESSIKVTNIPHYHISDFVKPYIIPIIIITLIIIAYVGILYMNLGIFRVVLTLLLRMVVSEGVILSLIQILRIPVGIYIIPVALLIYISITILTIVGYENEEKENKEQR